MAEEKCIQMQNVPQTQPFHFMTNYPGEPVSTLIYREMFEVTKCKQL